jgi:hypothetical protein
MFDFGDQKSSIPASSRYANSAKKKIYNIKIKGVLNGFLYFATGLRIKQKKL